LPKQKLQGLILELQESTGMLSEQSLERFKNQIKDDDAYEMLVMFLSICQTNEKKVKAIIMKLIFIILESIPDKKDDNKKTTTTQKNESTKTIKTPFGTFSIGVIIGSIVFLVIMFFLVVYFVFFLFRIDPDAAKETFDSINKITTHVISKDKG